MRIRAFIVLLSLATCAANGDDFRRELPDPRLVQQLTREKFPSADAVIILKEQLFKIYEANLRYRGLDFYGMSTVRSQNLIVKLLNEAAVKRYGTFEYEYPEWWGNDLPNRYGIRARVLKGDGEMWELDEDDVKNIVARENADGDPIARKVMFTIPNLAVGDVVQIEYDFSEALARSYSGIFFYADRDPILFSNLAVTLPELDDVRFESFPVQLVGQPKVEQLSTDFGAGATYFWSVKNLRGVPGEAYAPPFEEQSPLTAFVIDHRAPNGFKEIADWNSIARRFAEKFLDKDDVSASEITGLGFAPGAQKVTLGKTDSLYAALRRAIALQAVNYMYPLSEDISSVIKKKKGDASDLSYIFHSIVKQWGASPEFVWIRDRREGAYEELVPTISWFDRLGVLVTVEGKERLYDFDMSAPEQYEMPWFLNGIKVPVLSKKGCYHKVIRNVAEGADRRICENHYLHFSGPGPVHDSLVYSCSGAAANHLRTRLYALETSEVNTQLRNMMVPGCFAKVDSVCHPRILEEAAPAVGFLGESATSAEPIEALLSLKLKNYALRDLRERIFSTHRVNDVRLDEPFSIVLRWSIPVPAGYIFVSGPEPKTLPGPRRSSCIIAAAQKEGTLEVAATVQFPYAVFPRAEYESLVAFLDTSLEALEKDVVMKRK